MQSVIGQNPVLLTIGDTTREVTAVTKWKYADEEIRRSRRRWKYAAVLVAIGVVLWSVAPKIPYLQ